MKKTVIAVATAGLLLLGATGVFAATTYKTPAEIYGDLTGVTAEEAYEQRAAGEPYGVLAEEAGVYEEFREEMLENKKALIEQRVEDGTLTREQADIIISNMEANTEGCYGPGCGAGYGAGQGFGCGFGRGGMRGAGAGFGMGAGAANRAW